MGCLWQGQSIRTRHCIFLSHLSGQVGSRDSVSVYSYRDILEKQKRRKKHKMKQFCDTMPPNKA